MPGCQSYALIARSRGPLLLSLSQQTMNWEWKSVGKQGKDVKAPPWAWKKPLTELSFMIITLEESWLMSYTQSSRFFWSTGICDLFCPGIKAQATSAMQRRGKERRGRAGMEKEGKAPVSQARPSNQQLRDTDPFDEAGGSCLHGFLRLWNKQYRQRRFAASAVLSLCSPSPLPAPCSESPSFHSPVENLSFVFHCSQL